MLFYSTLGRIFGFHHSSRWDGGGEISFVGDISICVFIGCIGAGFLQVPIVWFALAFLAVIVGGISKMRANRKHQQEEDQLRNTNALNHPGVFDHPPPDDIDTVGLEELDVYDAGTCTYIGVFPKSDVKTLINAPDNLPEQGPNDILIIPESFEPPQIIEISPESLALLKKAFEKRDHLVLRWLPRSKDVE